MNLFAIMTGPVSRMSHVTRYSSYPVHRKENVAEHSWWVVFISFLITNDLLEMGCDINLRSVMSRAMVHDLDECLSGDIIRTFKYANDNIRGAIQGTAEENMFALCLGMEPVGSVIRHYWETAKNDDTEGEIVAFADMATVALYCREESRSGNRAIHAVLRESYENWFSQYHGHELLGRYIDQMFPSQQYTDMLEEREPASRMVPPGQMSLIHSEGPTLPWAPSGMSEEPS